MKVDPGEKVAPVVESAVAEENGKAVKRSSDHPLDPGSETENGKQFEKTAAVSTGLLAPDARGDAGGSLEVSPSAGQDFEAGFKQLCEDLILDVNTQAEASKLLAKCQPFMAANIGTIGSSSAEETERLWRACALFVVKKLGKGTSVGGATIEGCTAGFTLTQLLKASDLSVVDFFKEIPHFLAKCGEVLRLTYGDEWELKPQVKEVQANFVHMMVLCSHYKRVFAETFTILDGRGVVVAVPANGVVNMNNHMRFGWMLFLVLKALRMARFPDLVTCTHGLVCVMITLYLHMPVQLRLFRFDDNKKFPVRTSEGADLLRCMAEKYTAAAEDVEKLMEQLCGLIVDILKRQPTRQPSRQPHTQQEQLAGVIPAAKNWYYEGLLDERALVANLGVLEKSYDVAYHAIGDLDERMFMSVDQKTIGNVATLTPRKAMVTGGEGMMSPQKGVVRNFLRSTASPSRSPYASVGASPLRPIMGHVLPPSPVSSTMTNANWLRTVVSPLSGEPSDELIQFFKSATTPEKDIAAEVAERARVLLNSIFMQPGAAGKSQEVPSDGRPPAARALFSSGGSDARWGEQRALEAKKLYYRILESMCRIESGKTGTLALLLGNEAFHRSLLACASELVLAAHKSIQLQFPAVLTAVGITAFDFNKVTESFVRIEDTLPRELKRHLNAIDERILESLAWEKGSTLYPPLVAHHPELHTEVERLGLLPEPMPSLDTFRPPPDPAKPPVEAVAVQAPRRPPPPRLTIPTITSNLAFLAHERASAFQAFNAPIRAELLATQPSLQSTFMSPMKKNPTGNGETCASAQINVFFTKVLLLAKFRIEHLGKRLQQSEFILWQVMAVVEHALRHQTKLFFCRHIDQIILCSMYGVCKVRHADVTFKSTILQYKEQTQCKPHVFRNVFIDNSRRGSRNPEMGDIIRFYNEIYVPAIKVFLLGLPSTAPPAGPHDGQAEGEGGIASSSPQRSMPFQALPGLSPQKVSSKHNVYVSPLRPSKVEAMMAPQPRSLVAQLGGSPQRVPWITRDLDAINNRVNQPSRQRTRLEFGEDGGSPLVLRGAAAGARGNASNLSTDSNLSQASARSSARPGPSENVSQSPMKRSRMM